MTVMCILATALSFRAVMDPGRSGSSATPSALSVESADVASNETPTPLAPTPSEPPPVPETGTALSATFALVVAPDSQVPYDRDAFGFKSYDHDRNGCDIRNDVLRRDLDDPVIRPGTHGCVVESGLLLDPYTGQLHAFVRGAQSSSDVQIDHVISLADAWRSGAHGWDADDLLIFGNDPMNLLAVDGTANQEKSGLSVDEWLPADTSFHCEFVAIQVAVKVTYGLTVSAEELATMREVLGTCPDRPVPSVAETATP